MCAILMHDLSAIAKFLTGSWTRIPGTGIANLLLLWTLIKTGNNIIFLPSLDCNNNNHETTKIHTASLMILLTTELGRFKSSGRSAISTTTNNCHYKTNSTNNNYHCFNKEEI